MPRPRTRRWCTSSAIWILRLLAALAIPVVGFFILTASFDYLRDKNANRGLVVLLAIGIGVVGVFALYWAMNWLVDLLSERFREGVRPWVFVGPALVILSVFLLYPVINTIVLSLKDRAGKSLRRTGQLRLRLQRREHVAVDPQHRGVGRSSSPSSP